MRRSSRSTGTPATLSKSVHQQLSMYAIAASSAGVGILALAQPAQAKIVYTHTYRAFGPSGLTIDLNHDGIADFKLGVTRLYSDTYAVLAYSLRSKNRVFGEGSHDPASHLRAGRRIGPHEDKFQPGSLLLVTNSRRVGPAKVLSFSLVFGSTSQHTGPWSNAKCGYLGFKFFIDGKVHYGWARIHHVPKSASWHLVGYAYETIPNKPIIAGQTKGRDDIGSAAPNAALTSPTHKPATLGALAMGSSGLSIWRREIAESAQ
jgi:hypothetical protein